MSSVKTTEEVLCRCAMCLGQSVFPFDGEEGVPKLTEFGSVSNKTLSNVLNCTHVGKNDLVVFVGGFMDGLFCCMLKLAKEYCKLNPLQDVWYATHDSAKQIHKIIKSYNNDGKKIVLLGHSWGGDSAAHILSKNQDIHVDMLVTLDPVSKKGPPPKTENMGKWINIFVYYGISSSHHSNLLAKIGGPWGNVLNADINITHQEWGAQPKHLNKKELNQLYHYDVYWMLFCKTLEDAWKKILPETNMVCQTRSEGT